ncbi:Predicted lactoylglutathione lyase [Serratia marcescens]|nr:Predicted lactoylglutathione lyase [Serratia marcescens]CVA49336.1 Predicted lactoylglutathione lyase [Serratia marcescens]CVC46538.1 Predicted lactoylglutathione lyase [Serratia marcescens]CVD09035.1 Predicted lactoylglutathione lyase [Serratia marcescens]CVE21577.1 Predicted lactoylglutathione lyase [Serratia marcescens]
MTNSGCLPRTRPAGLRQATEVLVCLSQPSRAAVDELVRKAVAGGGNTYHPPRDYGVMYGHGFQDLDGHIWELMYMDPAAAQAQ